MRAFYHFVRQSVADDKPWDKFAREILTVRGNTLQHGQANYFMLHKDISDLTETTAVTFMGMSITCCRCHNHPLEKWTQDQYWSMGESVFANRDQEWRTAAASSASSRRATATSCIRAAASAMRPRRSTASPGEPSPVRGRVPEPRIAANISPTG